MAEIGSTVIYMGEKRINQVHGIQPVWGVKKSNTDHEQTGTPSKDYKKTFHELLKINWESPVDLKS